MSEYEANGQEFHVRSSRVMTPQFAPNDRGTRNSVSDFFEAAYESTARKLKKHPPRLPTKK
jgi:hypothetical protein